MEIGGNVAGRLECLEHAEPHLSLLGCAILDLSAQLSPKCCVTMDVELRSDLKPAKFRVHRAKGIRDKMRQRRRTLFPFAEWL
jgi:hypothetical protein